MPCHVVLLVSTCLITIISLKNNFKLQIFFILGPGNVNVGKNTIKSCLTTEEIESIFKMYIFPIEMST